MNEESILYFYKIYYPVMDEYQLDKFITQKFYSEYHNILPRHISKEFCNFCNIITEIILFYI